MQWLWNKYLVKHSNAICFQNILFLHIRWIKTWIFSFRMTFSDLIKINSEAYKWLAPVYLGTKESKEEEKRYCLLSPKSLGMAMMFVGMCVKRDKNVKH